MEFVAGVKISGIQDFVISIFRITFHFISATALGLIK